MEPGSELRGGAPGIPVAGSEAVHRADRPLPPGLSLLPPALLQIPLPFVTKAETLLPNRFESTTCQRQASGKIPVTWKSFFFFFNIYCGIGKNDKSQMILMLHPSGTGCVCVNLRPQHARPGLYG